VRLSEEKVERISELLIRMLRSRPDRVRLEAEPEALRREIFRFIVADLKVEDAITQEAVDKMKTYSRQVVEGTTEWMVLLAKHKDEIAARRGYVI
jgi:hypothetical protein